MARADYTVNYQPLNPGVKITISVASVKIEMRWSQHEAQEHVQSICRNAGLPEPWATAR